MLGNISLRCLGPHIWYTLPGNITEQISFAKFKESINSWYGAICKRSPHSYKKLNKVIDLEFQTKYPFMM